MTQFDILHAKYEAKAYRVLIKEFRKIFKTIPFDNFSIDHARVVLELNVNPTNLLPALEKLYLIIGLQYGGLVAKSIQKEEKKRKSPHGLFSEAFRTFILNYINTEGGALITSLSATMVNDIMREWEKVVQREGSIEDFRAEIQKVVNSPKFYRYQANRIARTETTYAMNSSQYVALDTSGVVADHIWLARMDGKERDDHRAMNLKPTNSKGEFVLPDGTIMKFPGDKAGGAKQCINCRCTYRYKARRDANGRLIFRD